mgnify:CR=1 FL=1
MPIVADSSSRILEGTGELSLSMNVVAFELPPEPTVWRLTPVDRAGNEGEPFLVNVDAVPDEGGCSVGPAAGIGGLFWVLLVLLPMRRRQ